MLKCTQKFRSETHFPIIKFTIISLIFLNENGFDILKKYTIKMLFIFLFIYFVSKNCENLLFVSFLFLLPLLRIIPEKLNLGI